MIKNAVLFTSILGMRLSIFAAEPVEDAKSLQLISEELNSIMPGYSIKEMEAVGVFSEAEKSQIRSIREINGKLVAILSRTPGHHADLKTKVNVSEVHRLAQAAQEKIDRIKLKGEMRVENSKEFQEAIFKNRAAAGVRQATYSFIRGLSTLPTKAKEMVGAQLSGDQSTQNKIYILKKSGAPYRHEEMQPKILIYTD